MISDESRRAFDDDGLVRLPGAVPAAEVDRMSDAVWEFLAAHQGVDPADSSTWGEARPSGFNPLARSGAFDGLWSPSVTGFLTDIFGKSDQVRERGRVLLTFPQADTPWDVPSRGWHFDYTPLQAMPGVRAVQVFALLSEIRPGGGGTVILTGSHRLVARYAATGLEPRPKLVRSALAQSHSWLADLWGSTEGSVDGRRARYLDQPVALDGVRLRVVEVTGSPGDVYVMNSDTFHAIAVNSRPVPRLMLTSLVTRKPE